MADVKKQLVCPLCKGTKFQREEGKIDGRWGVTAHNIEILICDNCKYIIQFFHGNTIWDMD
ncbi:MAG: hypothetical protein KA035_01460 [Candidatus Levybacteria bacterium]|nr:hypothetical protein [Candidatus Levybacteria bacterium]